jgi:hypothetical protein
MPFPFLSSTSYSRVRFRHCILWDLSPCPRIICIYIASSTYSTSICGIENNQSRISNINPDFRKTP